MRKKTLSQVAAILATAMCAQFAAALTWEGTVVDIEDGDTIVAKAPVPLPPRFVETERVRLQGVEAPELDQPYGSVAKQFISDLALERTVAVHDHGRDEKERTVGEVLLPDGRSLSRELVSAGLAWWHKSTSKDETLRTLEQQARQAKRGLWAAPDPVPPWEWRERHK